MKQATHELLSTLDRVDWFAAVGQPLSDPHIKPIASWQDAIAACQSDEWGYVTLEAKNHFTQTLAADFMEEYRKWNTLVREVKSVHEPMIERKSSQVISSLHPPKVFLDCVKWDLLMACMEQEYSEFVPLGFFTRLAQVYIDGHFPCGWVGPFPGDGPLLVY